MLAPTARSRQIGVGKIDKRAVNLFQVEDLEMRGLSCVFSAGLDDSSLRERKDVNLSVLDVRSEDL